MSVNNPDFFSENPTYFDEEKERLETERKNLSSLSLLEFENEYTKEELIILRGFAKQKKMRIKNAEQSEEFKKLIKDKRNSK